MFHVLLLEQDTTKKSRMNEFAEVPEFESDNKEYEVEAIQDSAVDAREANGHLLGLYYLVSWKGYPEKENTWEPASAIQHLQKLLSKFHHKNLDKPTVTFPLINTTPPMTKPTVKATELPKQKRGQPIGCAIKRIKRGNKKASKSVRF